MHTLFSTRQPDGAESAGKGERYAHPLPMPLSKQTTAAQEDAGMAISPAGHQHYPSQAGVAPQLEQQMQDEARKGQ